MPRDAKLGLVVGVGLVLMIAIVFFRKDTAITAPFDPSAPAAVSNTEVVPTGFGSGQPRPTPGTPAVRKPRAAPPKELPRAEPPPLPPRE